MQNTLSFMDRVKARKVELVALATGAATTVIAVSPVSAASFDINGTVYPLLDGISKLMVPIIALIIAIVPAIIIIGIVAFIVGFLGEILTLLKLK
jgi:hypothetical protein